MPSVLEDFISDELDRRAAIAAEWYDYACRVLGHEPFGVTRDQYIFDVICTFGPICFAAGSSSTESDIVATYVAMNRARH